MSRKVIVLKFGSSVLQSRADLPHAVHEIYRWIRRQYRVVAVVSAFAGETDRLLETVDGLSRRQSGSDRPHRRHGRRGCDSVSHAGTRSLRNSGAGARSQPDSTHRRDQLPTTRSRSAPISSVDREVLDQSRVAVIPGFVARDRSGRVALFGRGGSDLSALFLAKQLNARCRLIKDVDGIYNSDPATCSDAQRFEEIKFSDALVDCWQSSSAQSNRVRQKDGRGVRSGGARRQTMPLRLAVIARTLAARAHSPAPLKIGLLGLGTVGLGVFQELWKHPDLFEVTGIAVRRPDLHGDTRRQSADPQLLGRDRRRGCGGGVDWRQRSCRRAGSRRA